MDDNGNPPGVCQDAEGEALRAEIGDLAAWIAEAAAGDPVVVGELELVARHWAEILGAVEQGRSGIPAGPVPLPAWLRVTPQPEPWDGPWTAWAVRVCARIRACTRWVATAARGHVDAVRELSEIETAYGVVLDYVIAGKEGR